MESTHKLISCARCHHVITSRQYLVCSKCKQTYDLSCANVPDKRFYNTMSAEHKKNWRCISCINYERECNNITHRKPLSSTTAAGESDESSIDDQINEDQSILGDTICSPISRNLESNSPSLPSITLEQISSLLDKKLALNKTEILSQIKADLRMLFQDELQQAIKDIKQELNNSLVNITKEQEKLKADINELTKKIKMLDAECNQLKCNINNSQEQCKYIPKPIQTDIDKKIVLYGLEEMTWETESELYERVTAIFHDVMNVNLGGCIEDLNRLGKKGNRRPLVIELISKRMTNYVLRNRHAFIRSGMAINDFLNEESLQKRYELRTVLKEARRNGKHAVFRGNKLIINGKEYKDTDSNKNENANRQPLPITINNNMNNVSHQILNQNSSGNNTTNNSINKSFRN